MVRCFIGFVIPENVKDSIVKTQNEILKLPLVCKLVERENLHICFSFLGEVEEQEIEEIKDKINKLTKRYKGFDVKLEGIKAIPNQKFIRVIVLSVIDNENLLERIRKDVQNEIGGDSKPPHLTLCRVKDITNKDYTSKRLTEMGKLYVTNFSLDSIQLIKSELSRKGPIYTVIHSSKFM